MDEQTMSKKHYSRSRRTTKRRYSLIEDNFIDEEEEMDGLDRRSASSKKRKSTKSLPKRTTTEVENLKHLVSDTSSEDEDEYFTQRYSKRYLMSMVETLKEENRRLRTENARLRAFRIINQDLPEFEKLSEKILRSLKETSALVDSRFSSEELGKTEEHVFPEERELAPYTISDAANFPQNLLSNEKHKAIVARDQSSSMATEGCSEFQISSTLQNLEEGITVKFDPEDQSSFATEDEIIPENQDFKSADEEKSEKILVDLGAGCVVDVAELANCSRKSPARMTCDMLSLFFTKEDLATSSITGKVPNTHKHLGIAAKKQLDPAKIDAILTFVLKEFPVTGARQEIFAAIKNKCNNSSKSYKKEKEKSA